LPPWIVGLHHCGYDPRRILTVVYDDSEPAARLYVLAVEALAACGRVGGSMVRTGDCTQDHVNVVEQPWATPCQMLMRSSIEDDLPAVWIDCALRAIRHALNLRMPWDASRYRQPITADRRRPRS
jgi:hypothetical protein